MDCAGFQLLISFMKTAEAKKVAVHFENIPQAIQEKNDKCWINTILDRLRRSNDKILIVDDSLSMRKMVRFTLEQNQFNVTEAVDGVDAYGIAEQNTFDLVISDVNMPEWMVLHLSRNCGYCLNISSPQF